MPTSLEDQRFAQRSATVFHPINTADKTAMASLRAIVEPSKGRLQGTAARVPFDAIMERVAAPEDVNFEAGIVGGTPGWWCRPKAAQPGAAVLHIHGGWFNWGSAKAFRTWLGTSRLIPVQKRSHPIIGSRPSIPFRRRWRTCAPATSACLSSDAGRSLSIWLSRSSSR